MGRLTVFSLSNELVRVAPDGANCVSRAYQSSVSQQYVCRLKGQFSEEVDQQGLCVAGGFRFGFGWVWVDGGWARSLAWASGRRSTTLRGGFRFGFGWVWVFGRGRKREIKRKEIETIEMITGEV